MSSSPTPPIWVGFTDLSRHERFNRLLSPDAAEGFYRLTDAAYERRALAVSSNLHPSGFDEIMPETLATATVDRLLDHAHIVVTQGDSFRLTQATSDKS